MAQHPRAPHLRAVLSAAEAAMSERAKCRNCGEEIEPCAHGWRHVKGGHECLTGRPVAEPEQEAPK